MNRSTFLSWPAGRVARAALVAGGLALAAAVVPAGMASAAALPSNCSLEGGGYGDMSCSFGYTGAAQYFTVPPGVRSISAFVFGAAGGESAGNPPHAAGGLGAEVLGYLAVTPGETLQVNVGGQGGPMGTETGGFNGGGNGGGDITLGDAGYYGQTVAGGGGGASDIRDGAYTLADRLLVAAGGGGGGGDDHQAEPVNGVMTYTAGGGGGGSSSNGTPGTTLVCTGGSTWPDPSPCALGEVFWTGGGAGLAGSQTSGGGGGPNGPGTPAIALAVNCATGSGGNGGLGIGGSGSGVDYGGGDGGGGGGGYYGGGAGGCGADSGYTGGGSGGGGGGGSNYTGAATNVTVTDGIQPGNGFVAIVYRVAATSTVVASSGNPSTVGQPVTFTATVTGGSGAGTPTGTVTFADGGTQLGTATLDGSGTATFTTTTTPLAAGTHTITASYGGDSSFEGSTGSLTQTVNQVTTTTTGGSSQNPSVVGGQVTYTATVSPAPDGGTVAFTDFGTTITGCGAQPVNTSTGQATCQVTENALGLHPIGAAYSGDATYAASTGMQGGGVISGITTQLVQYKVQLLYDTAKAHHSGATVQVDLQLVNAAGTNLSAAGIPVTVTALSPSAAPGSAPAGAFTFLTLTQGPGYRLDINTTGYPAGTYTLSFTAGSFPLGYTAQFVIS